MSLRLLTAIMLAFLPISAFAQAPTGLLDSDRLAEALLFEPLIEDPCRDIKRAYDRMLKGELARADRLKAGGYLDDAGHQARLAAIARRHAGMWEATQEIHADCRPEAINGRRLTAESRIALAGETELGLGNMTGLAAAIDGDTLALGDDIVELYAIDAPEERQACLLEGRPYACGAHVRQLLEKLVNGRRLSCIIRTFGPDAVARAICSDPAGRDIAELLVTEGWALALPQEDARYQQAEEKARRERKGLWAGDFERPSDYRRRYPALIHP